MSTSPKERLETLNDHWWSRGRCAVSLDLLRRHLAHGEAKHALLLGSGAGALREKLEPICGEISGPLEEHLQKFGLTGDTLPYEDESFDLVCALDILGEAEDDEAVVFELRRVLSPEGLLLLAVPAHPWLYSDNDSGPRRRYTRRSLAKRLRDCDLTPERNTYANSLLFPLIAPAALAARLVDKPVDQRLRIPKLANELCYQAFAAERFLSRHVDLPLGQTLVALARRREATGWILPERAPERGRPRMASIQNACC